MRIFVNGRMDCFVSGILKDQEVWMKSNEMDFIDA